MKSKDGDTLMLPFGRETIIFGGDFQKLLSVVVKGSGVDIFHATY